MTGFGIKGTSITPRPGQDSGPASQHRKGVPQMLVLSRKLGEEIMFPGLNIVVQVVEVKRN
ncbi:carbon storage regulator, partial [Escherichia coli]|uniref:carbon storage regulator n=1 Tax=Escherichia coli TaxID=562 RepID=UPI0039E0F6D0